MAKSYFKQEHDFGMYLFIFSNFVMDDFFFFSLFFSIFIVSQWLVLVSESMSSFFFREETCRGC